MIADDEQMIREGLEQMLQGFHLPLQLVGSAKNGKEALAMAEVLQPDVILTDICMPKLSGLDFIRALQGQKQNAKIIIISGFHEFDYARQAISLGVQDYLLKPLQESELRMAMEKAVTNMEVLPMLDQNNSSLIGECLQILKNNYSDSNLDLSMVAKELLVHPDTLSRKLKKETGASFVEWLTKIRIQTAIDLITQGQYALYEVAEMVGYSNPHYFSAAFKNYTGKSPKYYKETSV